MVVRVLDCLVVRSALCGFASFLDILVLPRAQARSSSAPGLGKDDYNKMDLPMDWLKYFDKAIQSLNHRMLLSLRYTPKELLLGITVNTKPTDINISSAKEPTENDADIQMAHAEQQHLDGYVAVVEHAVKRKAAFSRRL